MKQQKPNPSRMRRATHVSISDFQGKLERKEIAHCYEFDCYYDTKTYEWLEKKCSDVRCEFCSKRPPDASFALGLGTRAD